MKVLRFIILLLIILGLSSFARKFLGEQIGSSSSYFLFGILLVYFFLVNKKRMLLSFLLLGILYFIISGIVGLDNINDYINKFIKYLIFIVAGGEVIRNSTKKEVYILLIIGALSVIINALIFPYDYGRYAGFYINPNAASLVCLIGYSFSYSFSDKRKLIGLAIFSIAGLLTLSRFFLLMWIFLSLVAIIINRKNIIIFFIGFGAFLLVVSGSVFLQLNTLRFSILQGLTENGLNQGVEFLQKNSRFDTWSNHYDKITDNPFIGNGYLTLSGTYDESSIGVHNTFLMIIGESGILPFLIFLIIYISMATKSFALRQNYPYLLLLSITIMGFFMVSHNYFDNYIILFMSMWIYINLNETDLMEETYVE